ncbi:efflux RND transporter periplasmic adaptor subunit [Pseudomonas sp. A014]|uniref:efflux RND transporter periplasmic adaptor subunit n=1 Tax=Pseudomonas sp. A014 TaxID=3458058 RepID=UPI0040370B1F
MTLQSVESDLWRDYPGRFEAVEAVQVRARVSGAVKEIHFEEGALINMGEPLLVIDPAPYQAEVERMRAQLAATEARRIYTQRDSERAERLWQVRAVSERDRDSAVNATREAQAQLGMARAELHAAELNLSYTQVRAPIAGRVGRREITVGNLVDAGPSAPVLTTLLSVDPIYASFEVDEDSVRDALASIGGDRSRLSNVPVLAEVNGTGASIAGRLQLIDNQVNSMTGTVRMRARFSNPDGALTPGQFARIRMGSARRERVLLVPEGAVGTDQNRRYVLVLGEDDRATYREVTIGASVDGQRVITTGLQGGERIVIGNLQRVRPGTQVAPQPVQVAALAANP